MQTTRSLPLLSLAALLTTAPAGAAVFTWCGGGTDGSVATAENWVSNTVPNTSGHEYVFTGTLNTEVTLNSSSRQLTGLTFDENAGAFIVRGEVPDSLANYRFQVNVASVAITQNSALDQALPATVYVANGNHTVAITGTGAGALALGSVRVGLQVADDARFNIERDVSLASFTLLGSGTLQLNISEGKTTTIGALAGTNLETAGNFSVRKYGEGTMTLTGFNKSGGVTLIEAGRLLLADNAIYGGGATTAAFTIKTGATLAGGGTVDVSSLVIEDGVSLLAGSNSGAGTLTLLAGTRTFGQNLHVGGNGVLNAGAPLNAQSLTIDDGGTLTLMDALTLANGGTLAGSGTLASSAGLVFGANAGDSVQVAITSGSTLAVIPAITGPANIGVTSGTLLVAGGLDAGDVRIANGAGFGGTGTVNSVVIAEDGAVITAGISGGGAAETLLLQGGLGLGTAANDIIKADVSINKTLHVAVPLTGAGKLEKSGAGVLWLGGNNAGHTNILAVTGGSLIIDVEIGSTFVEVASGAAFGGAGIVSGSLSLGAGATLLVG
ncbi:MAG: hypothetical protein LBC18_05195, partial [Opitutaceae bacterium]|nr:hypothetical protein [Opitutaceae bacterium]